MVAHRLIVVVALALMVTIRLGAGAAGQDATPAAESTGVDILVVQRFASGRLEPSANDPTTATITLDPPIVDAVFFSDRPNRLVGTLSAAAFLEQLAVAADNPPNAVVIGQGPSGTAEVIVELFSGTLAEDGTVAYQARILAEFDNVDFDVSAPLTELPETLELQGGHMVIDGLTQHKDNPT